MEAQFRANHADELEMMAELGWSAPSSLLPPPRSPSSRGPTSYTKFQNLRPAPTQPSLPTNQTAARPHLPAASAKPCTPVQRPTVLPPPPPQHRPLASALLRAPIRSTAPLLLPATMQPSSRTRGATAATRTRTATWPPVTAACCVPSGRGVPPAPPARPLRSAQCQCCRWTLATIFLPIYLTCTFILVRFPPPNSASATAPAPRPPGLSRHHAPPSSSSTSFPTTFAPMVIY